MALAELCHVSRTPIREALSRLEQDGLVERVERTLIVRRRSAEEILDIYEARIVLEATAGRIAAERRTDHDLRLLRHFLAAARAAADDQNARVESNGGFHRAVWRASHNESLEDLLQRLNLHLARYPATTLSFAGRWEQSIEEHAALADAIESRDGTRAHELSLAHFQEARDIRLSTWEDLSAEVNGSPHMGPH
jgi:DNA-binding GntR family transcriptional regulator